MCLSKIRIFPERAKEDIVVYKTMGKYVNNKYDSKHMEDGLYFSPFYGRIPNVYNGIMSYYKLGDTIYSAKSPLWGILTFSIGSQGVHCYRYFAYAQILATSECAFGREYSVIKCIIPKGTLYYRGKNNEIASGKLILSEEIMTYSEKTIKEILEKEKKKRSKGFGKKKKK